MTKREKASGALVNRRDFLALATSSAALAVTGWAAKPCLALPVEGMQASGKVPLDTGGIALEHFEAARKRAATIVARMTLEEKISQFSARAPAIERLGVPASGNYDKEALHGLIHDGPITSFPLPLALGCTWNRALIHRVFTAVSDEVWAWHKKNGNGLALFSPPTVNMGTRDPRWGRIGENYSEDPYLLAQMAIYTIHGMQGNDPKYLKTIACAKHFIMNDTEDDRHSTSATVDPRSFWEYYSRGFEHCVTDGHVFTVMGSYNAVNGIPSCANQFLLTELLRGRWGFRGYVVSDCDAISDICHQHHYVSTDAEAAALAVNAGCDINCGTVLTNYLGQAIDEMLISESTLDHSLIRSFTGRILLGEYDPPEQIPYNKIPISCLDSQAHRELALDAARQSIVLFKNENNTLPLNKTRHKKIAVIGPMADTCHLGNYSGLPWLRVSPLQGIKNALGIPAASYEKRGVDFSSTGRPAPPGPCGTDISLGPAPDWKEGIRWASGYLGDGAWVGYQDVIFTGATEFHVRVACGRAKTRKRAPTYCSENHPAASRAIPGGTIEVRLGSLTGPVVSTLKIPDTGGNQNWTEVSAPLKPTEGVHTVYLCFSSTPGSSLALDSFKLTPGSPEPDRGEGGTQVTFAMGCSVMGEKDEALFAQAIKAAQEADVALVVVGADERVDHEQHDRSDIHLPGVQHELVQAVYAANPRTILVISSNCPVSVNWEQERLPAIVGGLLLGEQQGNALADVLFGDYNPGGKTNVTWYRQVADLPDFHDYNIRHGRTYMYFKGQPLYPFGYGLSYTTFAYKNLQLSSKKLSPGGKITISVDVTNSGTRDGDEIVQVYVHVKAGTLTRPLKQLVNFDRIHLKAGETRPVSFELSHDDRALRYWDEGKDDFVLAPGTVDVMIGASSADIRLQDNIQLDASEA